MKLINGDCLEKLKDLKENSIDSIVTDPPYELGFMSKSWDSTGIAYNIELWKECLRVLKPGGHLLAFSGTRTYHRMAVAIEDAGFEVRDMIEWVYGSGFPKSLNIGKAVDKRKDWDKYKDFASKIKEQREELKLTKKQAFDLCKFEAQTFGGNSWFEDGRIPSKKDYELLKTGLGLDNSFDLLFEEVEREFVKKEKNWGEKGTVPISGYGEFDITKGTSEWEGWGTALKPAHEPICMARKPLAEKTVAENCLKWGTGGINIDESRVETSKKDAEAMERCNSPKSGRFIPQENGANILRKTISKPLDTTQGRFPANLIHDNSEEVRECFPETKSGSKPGQKGKNMAGFGDLRDEQRTIENAYGDSGNASRFFKAIENNDRMVWLGTPEEEEEYNSLIAEMQDDQVFTEEQDKRYEDLKKKSIINENYKYPKIDREYCKSIIYQPKASKSERNKGCEGLEEKRGGSMEANISDTMQLGGSSLKGKPKEIQPTKNNHPTVKPIKLMEYLIKMVTPKGGIVLDPFAGSGSTLVAAKQNGFDYVGIEMTEEYIPIIEARLDAVDTQNNAIAITLF